MATYLQGLRPLAFLRPNNGIVTQSRLAMRSITTKYTPKQKPSPLPENLPPQYYSQLPKHIRPQPGTSLHR